MRQSRTNKHLDYPNCVNANNGDNYHIPKTKSNDRPLPIEYQENKKTVEHYKVSWNSCSRQHKTYKIIADVNKHYCRYVGQHCHISHVSRFNVHTSHSKLDPTLQNLKRKAASASVLLQESRLKTVIKLRYPSNCTTISHLVTA